MILDVHVHHVPEAFVRFVEKATPYAVRLEPPRGESVTSHTGSLSYALNRTFFDSDRLTTRYLRSIYFDTICFEPCYARSVVEADVVDPSHLVLGSDTPFPLGEPDPVGFVEKSFRAGAPEFGDKILHNNAAAFLKSAKSGAVR
jgi:predicted TIM-barrel fold metal-dependent hydrolase